MIGQELGPVERSQENLCGGRGGATRPNPYYPPNHCSGDTINLEITLQMLERYHKTKNIKYMIYTKLKSK